MADSKISALTAATEPLTGAEQIAVVQSATTKMVDLDGVLDIVPVNVTVAVTDETTVLTTGTNKITFRVPAMTLTEVRASLTTAGTGATLVAITVNVNGVNIWSSGGTGLTIDAGEKTSTTAATPNVIGIAAVSDDAEITVDIDAIDTDNVATGLKVALIGTRA